MTFSREDQYADFVRGTVVGGNHRPYQFWYVDEFGFENCIIKTWFDNDEEAIAWFRENYPDLYAQGVEMRVYDI